MLEELQKIETLARNNSAEKKAMEYSLLEKETKLLRKLEVKKAEAMEAQKLKRIEKRLHSMTEPKKWRLSSACIAEVHTPSTVRAIQLRDLYESIMDNNLAGNFSFLGFLVLFRVNSNNTISTYVFLS